MIVKSLRHTSPSFDYIVEYLNEGMPKNPDLRWALFHNLSRGIDRQSIIQEFEENSKYLKQREDLERKKTIKYHEILGFSKESTLYLTTEKLKHLALEYIRLRDPENASIALCVPHIEKDKHIHLHLLFSSNHIGSDRASDMRMDNATFYRIRREIERYMLRHYPELHHSVVYLNDKEIEKLIPLEYQEQRSLKKSQSTIDFGRQSKKKQLAETIQLLLDNSTSLVSFIDSVNQEVGIKTYSRKEKLTGIIKDGKKYRFSTLGIQLLPENLKVLERMDELKELEQKQQSKQRINLER
jgi:hypothetical protein